MHCRKLKIILWKGIKILSPWPLGIGFQNKCGQLPAKRLARDSVIVKATYFKTVRGRIIRGYSQTEAIEHQDVGISGRLPLGTGRWSTENGLNAIEQ